MNKNNISSRLIEKLKEKSDDSIFNDSLYTIFSQFAYKVNLELKQINQIFNEYTPHDDIHMQSLFRIADELLKDKIDYLNGIELCILACAMYGHDWGMAVSKDEKELIVTGQIPKNKKREDFALLDNEKEVWKAFAKSNGIPIGEEIYVNDHEQVGADDWREYVRRTHAQRAFFRAKHYFSSKGDLESLGPILGSVCEGHWYDISKIKQLETKSAVGGKIINLRALAIYTRFIDLLDIGNNRTPFALRVFINPKDSTSSIEWKKHQAINPVVLSESPTDSNDTVLHFHGGTNNHIVYAALQDLKRYCQNQIEENIEELKTLANYSLGNIKLDWKIQAIGFEPIDVRFEFDRKSMFDLVGGEIYDGDPYVFIRELLQNAIDAILLRISRHKQNNTAIIKPFINIEVTHKDNGNVTVSISDCGVGMSINVVRNYLATIGKSYYRSKEFNDLKTGMKSISRFGVGLISCFEVADSIQIETETDGGLQAKEFLLIEISDKNQQFRVEKKSPRNRPGTTVTVEVIGEKWRKNEFSNETKLKITDYIKAVAGFVPFPILVNEDNKNTAIFSAAATESEINEYSDSFKDFMIYRHPLTFDFDKVIEPQDVDEAGEILQKESLHINSEKNGIKYFGTISRFNVKESVLSSFRNVSGGVGSMYLVKGNNENVTARQLRWIKPDELKKTVIASSINCSHFSKIYFNGILVPELDVPLPGAPSGVPRGCITLNLSCENNQLIPTLSRKSINISAEYISDLLALDLKSFLSAKYYLQLVTLSPIYRLLLLARLSRYVCNISMLKDVLPIDEWPLVLLETTGKLTIVLVKDAPEVIDEIPKYFLQINKNVNSSYAIEHYLNHTEYKNAAKLKPNNPMAIISLGFEHDDGSPQEWNEMDSILKLAIEGRYQLTEIRVEAPAANINNPFIIKRRTKLTAHLEDDAPVRSKFNPLQFKFYPFPKEQSNVLCVLPLSWGQSLPNHLHEMIFNLSNPIGAMLKLSLENIRNNESSLEAPIWGKLKDALYENVLIERLHPVSDHFNQHISNWASKFCLTVASFGLITLTEKDYQELANHHETVICRE